MSKNSSSRTSNRSKAKASGASATNAPAIVNDADANPPGMSVPGGTNTTASESGDAASLVPAERVKPLGEESTEGKVPEATTPSMPSMPPEAEASASGTHSPDASQAGEAAGAGQAAGPDEAPLVFGVDYGMLGSDRTVFSWFGLPIDEESHPRLTAFIQAVADRDDDQVLAGRIRVKAKSNGFRRAGIVHSETGQDFAPGDLSAGQLEVMLGEPELTVEIV